MNKIKSFFGHITHKISTVKLTTPSAIIIGSIIISLGIVAYGYVVRPVGEVARDLVKEVAKELRLKGSKWESCLASQEVLDQVQKELNDGTTAGVSGTPTTFVLLRKGNVYETLPVITGAQDVSIVRQTIEQALLGNVKTVPFAGAPVSDSDFVKGVRGDVLVVEYADAECPFCVQFHSTMTTMMSEYQDRVGFVYRHFPLPPRMHPNAARYAAAIECAGKLKGQDAYFGFIDKMFTKQAGN